MGYSIVQGLNAYAKQIFNALFLGCKTAILNNEGLLSYSKRGVNTLVREVDAGAGGLYDKSLGWNVHNGGYGGEDTVTWREYAPKFDTAKTIEIDLVDELNSYTEGMESSLNALVDDYINRRLAATIDAANIATLASQVPEANIHADTEAGWQVDKDNIFGTLAGIQAELADTYDGPVITFINTKVYAALQQALLAAPTGVLAMYREGTIPVRFDGFGDYADDYGEGFGFDLRVVYFGNLILVKVPSDRMYTRILMLNGLQGSEGQEVGGYLPDTSNPDFAGVDLLAVPTISAFASIKWLITQYLVPAYIEGVPTPNVDVLRLNEMMFGQVEVENAGINQVANSFKVNNRCLFGADIIKNRANSVYMITGEVGPQTITSTEVVIDTPSTDAVTLTEGDTLQIQAHVLPYNTSDKALTYATMDEGTATVSTKGLVTAVAGGQTTITVSNGDINKSFTVDVDVAG